MLLARLVIIIAIIAVMLSTQPVSSAPIESESCLAVAVHVSEYTKSGGLSLSVQSPDYAWRYFQIYTLLEEALISDGTPFVEVSDADIAAGGLLTPSGAPKYPIFISLAAECISDAEAQAIRNYVSRGGMAYVGASAWTRKEDGSLRTSFALASEMGLESVATGASNWSNIGDTGKRIQRIASHPLVNHLPANAWLQWPLPNSYYDTMKSYPNNSPAAHPAWVTSLAGATPLVLIEGTNAPLLAAKSLGSGWFIYHAELSPLAGWGEGNVVLCEYAFFRNAIEWAFLAQGLPLVRVAAWPWPHHAAFVVRHDDITLPPDWSVLYEEQAKIKGQYFVMTGSVDPTLAPAALGNAQNHGAVIGSHSRLHVGADTQTSTTAYSNINTSLISLTQWLGTRPRTWVSPFFGAILDSSFLAIDNAGLIASGGEQIVGPFPHYALSMVTEKLHYAALEIPSTFWIRPTDRVLGPNDGTWSHSAIEGATNLVYDLGGVIGIYDHLKNSDSLMHYINYGKTLPWLWNTSAEEIANWWPAKSSVKISSRYLVDGVSRTVKITASGATSPLTALDITRQHATPVTVSIGGSPSSSYRQDGFAVKVNSGTAQEVELTWNAANAAPVAMDDSISVARNTPLTLPAPGVLANDTDFDGNPLTVALASGPAHGTLTLNADGSFSYTPATGYTGSDSFTYLASDGQVNSNPAKVTLTVAVQAATFGLNSGNAVSNEPANYLEVMRFQNTAGTGVLTKLELRFDSTNIPGGKVRLGIYADNNGYPGVRLLDAGEATTINGWASISGLSLPVTQNTYYWLGFVLQSSNVIRYQSNLSSGVYYWARWTYGTLPTQYPAASGTTGSQCVMRATVTSGGNVAPAAVGDVCNAIKDRMLNVAAPGVLANDSDPEGDPLTAALASGPAHGTLTLNADGSFSYAPAPGYAGSDTFNYLASDGKGNATPATVNLTVAAQVTTFGMSSGSGAWNKLAGYLEALRYQNTVGNGVLTKLELYFDSANVPSGKVRLGVYADNDGSPGNLLLDAGEATVSNGWVAISGLSLPVKQNTYYWLTFDLQNPNIVRYQAGQPAGSHFWLSYGYNVFPAQYPAGASSYNIQYAMLATVNATPVAGNDAYVTGKNKALIVNTPGVLTNDSDANGDPLTVALVSGPTYGALTLSADGSFSYTPATDYTGNDAFTYLASDGRLNSTTTTVALTIKAANIAPVAANDTYEVNQNTVLTVNAPGVLANDSDGNGDPLMAVLVSGPAHGTLTLNADGSFSYTPTPGYAGSDSFTYLANDGQANSNTATVDLTVKVVNVAPVAVNDNFAANQDTTLNVSAPGVLGNDSDGNGDPLTAALASGPAHGTLTLNANGSFSYTPAAGYAGSDTFTYQASDGKLNSNTATVTLPVKATNIAPVAVNDTYEVILDTPLTVNAPGILGNDSDGNGDPLTAALASGPAHGTLTLNANGSFTYTPAAGYLGSDSFTYLASDGLLNSASATVALNIVETGFGLSSGNGASKEPANYLEAMRFQNTAGTGVLTKLALLFDSTNIPSGKVRLGVYADNDGYPGARLLDAGEVATSNSWVAISGLGLKVTQNTYYWLAFEMQNANSVRYQSHAPSPNPPYFWVQSSYGPLPAQYPAGGGSTNAQCVMRATVTFGNILPVAVGDAYELIQDMALNVVAPGVLDNDSDANGDVLTAALVSGPAHGTLTLNTDGSFSYTPAVGYAGNDAFTYLANDGQADSNAATVALTIKAPNVAPVAVNDAYSINQDTVLTVSVPSVLANDSDANGDVLTAALVSGPAHGTLTLNANGSFSYTPAAGYAGSDSFTYLANDGQANSNTATVALTVKTTNDTPVAANDTYVATQDTALTVNAPGVLANDSDANGDAITAAVVSGPAHGTLTLNANGSFSYTPAAGYTGSDSFTYLANDGLANSAPATVALTVKVGNAIPVTANDAYSINQNTALNVSAPGVLANDTDANGDPLTAVLASGPAHGTLTLNANGSFSYTPTAGYVGSDSFTYRASDGQASSNTATVALTVKAVNFAPVAVNDAYSVNLDQALNVAAPGVLANDSDANGDVLTAALVGGPAHGTLTLNANGSFSYTPAAGYQGSDAFTYQASDGKLNSNTATVVLTIAAQGLTFGLSSGNGVSKEPANYLEVMRFKNTVGGGLLSKLEILFDSTNVPSGKVRLGVYADNNGYPGALLLDAGEVSASNGWAAIGNLNIPVAQNSYYWLGFVLQNANSVRYQSGQVPAGNYYWARSSYGTLPAQYPSGGGTINAQCVMRATVAVSADAPPIATNDAYNVLKDTVLSIAAPGVLTNDTDVNGNPLAAALVSGPAHGTLTLNANGSFSYTPAVGYTGNDTFTYLVNNGKANSNTATATITIGEPTFGLNSGNAAYTEPAGYLEVMRFQNTVGTGVLTKLELLIDSTTTPSGKVRLGVYADNNGAPGARLLDAGEVAATNGWVAISGLNLPVTQNTYYWLAFDLQSANAVRYQSGQPAGAYYWVRYSYNALPAQYPAGGGSNSNQCVMRATVSVGP